MVTSLTFKVEKNPTADSKLILTINRQPLGEWFKEQFNKLRQGVRKSAEEPRKIGDLGCNSMIFDWISIKFCIFADG